MNQQQDPAGSSAANLSNERSLKEELTAGKGKIADLAQTATSAGKAQLDTGLAQAAGKVDKLAHAVDEAANRLKEENQEGLASFATYVASSVSSLADRLRERSVDDLASEARELARSNPAMFLAGSVAVGFGLTRFLKASSRVTGEDGQVRSDRFGNSYGDSRTSRDARSPGGSSWDERSGTAASPSSAGAWPNTSTSDTSGGARFGGTTSSSSSFPAMNTASGKSASSGSGTDPIRGGSHG